MNSAFDLVGDPGGPSHAPAPSVASWYAHGLSDGLGDRLLMFDNTPGASLELLRFRREFAEAPGFESALRGRVGRLASFDHPAFARARAVEHLEGEGGLALVSMHVEGKRLSELLVEPHVRGGVHPAFAVWLIRQVTAALGDLDAHGGGMAHGVLTPQRIVLTPDGRLVIVEHVLGTAVDALQLGVGALWARLGILVPAGPGLAGPSGRYTDTLQLGVIALSLLLGRQIGPDDYAQRLGELLDEFSATAEARSPTLAVPLRNWLAGALQFDARGFFSAIEAQRALDAMLDRQAPRATRLPLPATEFASMLPDPDPTTSTNLGTPEPPHTPDAEPLLSETWQVPEPIDVGDRVPASWLHAQDEEEEGEEEEGEKQAGVAAPRRAPVLPARTVAIALGVFAAVEAIIIGLLLAARPTTGPGQSAGVPAPIQVPITIESSGAGDVVIVDGRAAGTTPFTLAVDPSVHLIRIAARPVAPVPVGSAVVAPPGGPAAKAAPPSAPAVTGAPLTGALQVSSSIDLQVLEGDRVLGSSATGPVVLTTGLHELDLVSGALGYRSHRTVQIKAGQVVPLRVQLPDGRVSINAQPWAQAWIDGNLVGETPLANLPVTIGEHEIILRHPQLGEHRELVVVKPDALTRVSATLAR
jgi:hypothetical protein